MKSIKNKKSPFFGMYILTALIITVVVPGVMAAFMKNPIFSEAPGGVDGWLSYWGGYLGGVIGMITVIATTIYLIDKQNINHQLQIVEQKRQHVQLLENQNEQHQEQIAEQRRAIERAAELNDRKERERIYLAFIFRQNEEVLEILMNISGLYLERHNLLRKIFQYKGLLEELPTTKQSNESKQEANKHYVVIHNKANDDEAAIRGKIILLLTELRVKSRYFSKHQNEVFNFAEELQNSFQDLNKARSDDDTSAKKTLRMARDYKSWVEKEMHSLLELFTTELEENLKELNSKKELE